MAKTVSDLDMILEWSRTGADLKVRTVEGTLLFSSATGFVSHLLSERQVKWVSEDYNRKKKNYVFA